MVKTPRDKDQDPHIDIKVQMGTINQIEELEKENVPPCSDRTRRRSLVKIPSITEKKIKKTKSDVILEALYLQEGALDKDIV